MGFTVSLRGAADSLGAAMELVWLVGASPKTVNHSISQSPSSSPGLAMGEASA